MIVPATSSDLTSKWLRHASAAAVFLGVALLWTFPLVRHLESHLLGQGIGDNVTSVWNFWWMRYGSGRWRLAFLHFVSIRAGRR